MREKQKVKRIYNLLERQFRRYFDTANRNLGNTGEVLMSTLERRLDNVIYRLNLTPTRSSARQLITHGHITVDGKKVDIPSFLVESGMVITPRQKTLDIPLIKKQLEDKSPNIVSWLSRKGPVGKVTRLPKREDIPEDINEQLIIEFYSR